MKQNKLYNTAIYCRLSLDDGNDGDSSSIKIQKITEQVTNECMEEFEKEYQKNLSNHSDELPGHAKANAIHDSIPAPISSITRSILGKL